jgi:hypothetical protein
MSEHDWTPDEPLGTETFRQGDAAADEAGRLDPEYVELLEVDPTLDPNLQIDERELEEVGAELDDPEAIVILDGMIDDPDGIGGPPAREMARRADTEGWDLDAPLAREDVDDMETEDA